MRVSSAEVREEEVVGRRIGGVLTPVRTHKKLVAGATLAGLVLGLLAALLVPQKFTAEARVAVGAGTLTTSAIAGYPLAAQDLAANYARYINDTGLAGHSVPEGVKLTASPIPESNVIRIEAESSNRTEAELVTKDIAETLVRVVNSADGVDAAGETGGNLAAVSREWGEAYADVQTIEAELNALRQRGTATTTELQRIRDRLAEAKTRESIAQARREVVNATQLTDLLVVTEPGPAASDRGSYMQRFGLIGTVVGFAVGLILAHRRDARRQDAPGRNAARRDNRPATGPETGGSGAAAL
jgi:hypothetical protein